jgi:thioredoxin reductase
MAHTMTHDIDVLILGGGAAGLFCAFTAGQRGRSVMVLILINAVTLGLETDAEIMASYGSALLVLQPM